MKKIITLINLPEKYRKYLYGVAAAALALAAIYGLLDNSTLAAWSVLISQLIGLGGVVTAAAHMPDYMESENGVGGRHELK